MPSPLAFLAGFGQGAAGLGQDMETQAALQEAQRSRRATDALTRLATMVKLGAQPVTPGTDPTQALQAVQNRNTQQAGLVNAPGAGAFSGGIDPSQFGQPQIANLPTAAGGQDSFILDPSRTPEALAELRAGRAEDARYRQATDVENQRTKAAADLKAQEAKATNDRSASEAVGFAHSLNALDPKNPLLKSLPDPLDTAHWTALAPSLKTEVDRIGAEKLQASQYHATPHMWTESKDVDANGQPIFVDLNSPTLERKTLSGAQRPAAGGGGTPQQKASLVAGLNTLTTADKDATAYEDQVLKDIKAKKSAGPGWFSGTLGAFADPASHHDVAPAAGGALNFVDPGYAVYNKSLTAAANAGMLISQRPSDVRLKKEQFLAGISTNPTEDQIFQARQWRKDMKAAFESAIAKAPGGGGSAPDTDLEAYIANRGGKKKL